MSVAHDLPHRIQLGGNEVGMALTDPQALSLARYLQLLTKWNKVYNLTSVRELDQMLVQHVFDCLAVLGPLRTRAGLADKGDECRLLDVGSGGGLPGVVIALCMGDVQVTCVDAVRKKATFITQVAAELALPNLKAVHARVEDLEGPAYHVVTSRAFASLALFSQLTRHLVAPTGVWMAMKGKSPGDEIAQLGESVDVFHVEQLEVPQSDAERCLVWMRPVRSDNNPPYAPLDDRGKPD